ncbi:4'-phosphopantetheinyl transferase [Oscillatoriales cyanobacterium USR001]|nr:4'-phosphopantetheinyl transferase [Oscillatoriales cyanobacterium USR001]
MSNITWNTPPQKMILSSNNIHIWRANLHLPIEQIETFFQTLSADEKIRAEKFHFDRHRNFFIAARGILRAILSRYLEIKPHQLRFNYSTRGKPEIAENCGVKNLEFNLSHSEEIAIYGITCASKIGIDIEKIRSIDDAEQIAKRFFAARECSWLSEISPSEKPAAFFRLWTCKEAYLKAIGEGLAFGLDRFEISFSSSESPTIISIQGSDRIEIPWFLQQLTPVSGYVGSVAVKVDNPCFHYWQWPGNYTNSNS